MYLRVNKLKIFKINTSQIRTYCNTDKVEEVKVQKQCESPKKYKRPIKRTINKHGADSSLISIKDNNSIQVYKILIKGCVFCVSTIGIAYLSPDMLIFVLIILTAFIWL